MHDCYGKLDFEHNGKVYSVRIEAGDVGETPWDWADGHGPVSEWTTRDKKPGEWVLCTDRNMSRFYDFQAAVRKAKRENWGATEDDRKTLTPGQLAEKAVKADFDYLKAWCDDDWRYAYVCVDNPYSPGDFEGIGGCEYWFYDSDKNKHLNDIIIDLINDIEYAHNKELTEQAYWARQGVYTEVAA